VPSQSSSSRQVESLPYTSMRYSVKGTPPADAGAAQEMRTPPVAASMAVVGLATWEGAAAASIAVGSEKGPQPHLFLAFTLK
jgi:hypothetical protein